MGGGSDLSSLSGGENCILGITAGILTKLTNYPLLSWKNTVQQGLPISFNPKIVYRGLVMACLNLGGTTGVQFGTTGQFQKMLASAGATPTQTQMGGAFLGGLVSGLPCSLWELTMIQQQRFGNAARHAAGRLHQVRRRRRLPRTDDDARPRVALHARHARHHAQDPVHPRRELGHRQALGAGCRLLRAPSIGALLDAPRAAAIARLCDACA